MTPSEAPVSAPAEERMEAVEVLGGFALLWILLLNVFVFSGYEFLGPEQVQAFATHAVDGPVKFVRHWLVEIKDLSLLSLFFGVTLGVLWRRARAAGRSPALWGSRWQGALLVLGALHAVLVWGGDVLAPIALLGLVALLFAGRSDRTLLGVALAIYLLPIPLYAASLLLEPAAPYQVAAELAGEPNLYGLWMAGLGGGDPAAFLRGNLAFLTFWWTMFTVNWYWPDVLGMLLVGLWLGRSGRLEGAEPGKHLVTWRRVAWAAAVGIAGNLAFAVLTVRGVYYPPSAAGLLLTGVQYLTVPALVYAYAGGLVLLVRWRRVPLLRRALGAVGRMPVTQYLLQSVLCGAVFFGLGLGWFGRVGASVAVLVGLAVYGLQVALGRAWWALGFAEGPVEWLAHQVAEGRRLPLRSGRRPSGVAGVRTPAGP